MARQITSHEVDTIKWWLETRKFSFAHKMDERLILALKSQLLGMVEADIEANANVRPMSDKRWHFLGVLTSIRDLLANL
jgi:hypothetical protein